MIEPKQGAEGGASVGKATYPRFPVTLGPVLRRVTALALPGVVSFDLGCVVQAFARGPGPSGEPAGFELRVCTERPGRVSTPDGFDLHVEHGLEALDDADLVVVPARYPHDERPGDDALDALRAAGDRSATIASICLGAFVLGHAGLLDHRPATTHWAYCDQLATTFPTADVRPQPLYVDDGDIVTSAGLAAGLDMCLHIVRRELGAAAAARLACWNVVAPHREGGQAQFIPPVTATAGSEDLQPTMTWALDHLDERLPVSRLARHAGVSERTFSRRFRRQVGMTPHQWLLARRVNRVRELLETSDHTLERIAAQSGFPSDTALRQHLRRHTHMTPTTYRRAHRTRPSPRAGGGPTG